MGMCRKKVNGRSLVCDVPEKRLYQGCSWRVLLYGDNEHWLAGAGKS